MTQDKNKPEIDPVDHEEINAISEDLQKQVINEVERLKKRMSAITEKYIGKLPKFIEDDEKAQEIVSKMKDIFSEMFRIQMAFWCTFDVGVTQKTLDDAMKFTSLFVGKHTQFLLQERNPADGEVSKMCEENTDLYGQFLTEAAKLIGGMDEDVKIGKEKILTVKYVLKEGGIEFNSIGIVVPHDDDDKTVH